MSSHIRLCPVCHRSVEPTRAKNIAGPLDKNHTPCPASYQLPYTHTLTQQDPPCASTNANDATTGGPPTPHNPPKATPNPTPADSAHLAFPPSATNSPTTHPANPS